MFCVPSYSSPVPRAAADYSRVSTGQKVKWLGSPFRFCRSVTLAKSTAENIKFPISALLTRECLLGSWDDALPSGSRSPFPCLQTHTHRFKGVNVGEPELLQLWSSPFIRPEYPQARVGKDATVQRHTSSAPRQAGLQPELGREHPQPGAAAIGAATPQAEMVRDVLMQRTVA